MPPHVLAILLLVAPRSEDAPASSLPAPQWSENPGHQIHLGRNTGKMNNQALKAQCKKMEHFFANTFGMLYVLQHMK